MNLSYEIEKPISDLNPLTSLIKYIVLFIVLFLSSWVAIPLFLSKGRATRVNPITQFLAENAFIFSFLITIAIISWFIYNSRKQYKFGEVYRIDFNDAEQKLYIKSINLSNNLEKETDYDYKNISFSIYNTKDALFGKQRILSIFNHNNPVHVINIDRTGWCRNENIDNLIYKAKNWVQRHV